jgi:hypothetical protein
MKTDLRLGFLIESLDIPAWAYWSSKRIAQLETVEFVLLIIYSISRENYANHRNRRDKYPLLYELFNRIDKSIFIRSSDAFERKNIKEIFTQATTINVGSISKQDRFELDQESIERVQKYNLDILIYLGHDNPSGGILETSKYGVWTYKHSDERVLQGNPDGFWEVIEDIPETGAALQCHQDGKNHSRVLSRSYYFTYPFSPARNRNALFWSASSILPRQIEALSRLGGEDFMEGTKKFNQETNLNIPEAHVFPRNYQVLKAYFHVSNRIMGELIQRVFYKPTWFLIYKLDDDPEIKPDKLKQIFPPKDRFWADPHAIFSNGRYYVFIEEFLYQTNKGRISYIEIDPEGRYKDPVCVLEEEHHLSYPFIFEWKGIYYMVPESAQKRSIDLYECVDFPNKWEFRQSLMSNVRAVDTTLLFDQGCWWLFTALKEHESSIMPSELFLFYSTDLFTADWIPHPSNPIISDIKKARPAGAIFYQDGRLFRPSQYISRQYGFGFDINEITILSEKEYAETEHKTIRPMWNDRILATHTFARVERLTIIDAFTQRKKWNGHIDFKF